MRIVRRRTRAVMAQYAPVGRIMTRTVRHMIIMSLISDQFST
jgi:hypothetical protein